MAKKDRGPARKYAIGQRFGRWTLVARLGYQGGEHSRWRVRCDCGNEAEVLATNVTTGQSTQCGSCAARAKNAKRRRGDGGRWA